MRYYWLWLPYFCFVPAEPIFHRTIDSFWGLAWSWIWTQETTGAVAYCSSGVAVLLAFISFGCDPTFLGYRLCTWIKFADQVLVFRVWLLRWDEDIPNLFRFNGLVVIFLTFFASMQGSTVSYDNIRVVFFLAELLKSWLIYLALTRNFGSLVFCVETYEEVIASSLSSMLIQYSLCRRK